MRRHALLFASLLCTFPGTVTGRGVSPYLPLNLEPEIERQIERLLILADEPVLRRPIPAATVLDALPKACVVDPLLCQEVRRFLARYGYFSGVTYASGEVAATRGSDKPLPNRYGTTNDSSWWVTSGAYVQPDEHVLISVGAVAHERDVVPSGSMLSLGFDRAQLDVGYRPRWLSPFTDSSMLVGTQAGTMPSVTLSNYTPLTRLGLQYEAFVARMSRSGSIRHPDGLTEGHPKLAGLHLSAEPASGWALGVSRILQYGGGARGSRSFGDLLEAFFRPSDFADVDPGQPVDDRYGNQLTSVTSRFLFPGDTPFAMYFEYAGEDTSRGHDWLPGNAALSAGIHFPRVWSRFDLAYEVSEWQNGWYVDGLYGDGLTNEGHVVGHWAGDERGFGDAVGGRSHMVRLGWEPRIGGIAEVRYRSLENERYSAADYRRGWDVTLRYSRPVSVFLLGAEVFTGRDVFGEDFTRVGAFVRYSDEGPREVTSFVEAPGIVEVHGLETFVELGVNASEVRIDLDDTVPRTTRNPGLAPHFALGARRAVGERHDLGARIELDDVDGRLFVGARALDYRYRLAGPLALTLFAGAARYDLATPAFGPYGGVGAQWRDLRRGWDLGIELRYAADVARDDLVPADPAGGRPDSFYDIRSATLSIARRF